MRIWLAVCVAWLWVATAEARENHALLIGASSYQNLHEQWWLLGPANDVELVAQYLQNDAPVPFEAGNITVLADGVEGAGLPTLNGIRQAFAELTRRVGQGDFVYLHFSGHGSQAPALDPASEFDGLDEMFLPIDIGPWSDGIGAVENALIDDEIGQMIDGLKAKGAEVWVVFDSCHSGTATRGAIAAPNVRLRKLPPRILDIPRSAMRAARPRTRGASNPRRAREAPLDAGGNVVAFFAAQTNETTPEKNMPADADEPRPQGVFTYTLFQTLAENPNLTYQQLAEEVLRKYTAFNLAQSTPLFQGDLNRPVFGTGSAEAQRQWPVKVSEGMVEVAAGDLHGLAKGEVLALMQSPTQPSEAAIGYYEIDDLHPFKAKLHAVDHNGKAAVFPEDLPRAAYLRKINANLDFSLSVALPPSDDPMFPILERVLEEITKDGRPLAPRLRVSTSQQDADIRLHRVSANNVAFLPASGVVDDMTNVPKVRVAGKPPIELANDIEDNLLRISKALNLIRVGGGPSANATSAEVRILSRTKQDRTLRPLDFANVPRLATGDEVHIEAHNPTSGPIDVNLLHIGIQYGITHLGNERLQPGDTLKMGAFAVSDDGFGRDRIIAVLSPAAPQTIVENLAFLQQKQVPRSRAVGASTLQGLFRQAGFGTLSRSITRIAEPDAGPGPRIMQFAFDTVPAR